MANVYDFLGADRDWFMKSSLNVYTDLSGSMQYVGKTENEKTLRFDPEYVEWNDNTSGVQTLYIKDNDKFSMYVDFSFMQTVDSNAIAIAFNSDWDKSDANYQRHFFGSNPNPLAEAQWRFSGQSRSGLDYLIVIRKGVITVNGEQSIGALGQYTQIPVTCSALQDTTITDDKRDLGYIQIEKQTSGS